jgi:hypothetical protein
MYSRMCIFSVARLAMVMPSYDSAISCSLSRLTVMMLYFVFRINPSCPMGISPCIRFDSILDLKMCVMSSATFGKSSPW